jgi:hypothetical protein
MAFQLMFQSITNTNTTNAATGAAQLFVDVMDPAGAGDVLFAFYNTGPIASSITDVYFDDGSLLAIASISNGPDVSFSQGANPPNLPGWNLASPPFNTTAGFSADSNMPVMANGINPGEWMKIMFTLQNGREFSDVITDLRTGALRVGVHIQAFANENSSESFVNLALNYPLTPVPEPSVLALFALGVAMLVLRRRTVKRSMSLREIIEPIGITHPRETQLRHAHGRAGDADPDLWAITREQYT